MQIVVKRLLLVLSLSACAASCAGNGEGLDQNGQPISAGGGKGGPITADFQSIQDNVFTPICSKCHIGASAPEGLQLDSTHSYNLLVGVPSNEQPNLLRVKPGDPDNSYMVHKIEGLPRIAGGQMPLGEAPLTQATIDAIRQWITNGASNSTATAQDFAMQTSAPLDRSALIKPPARIVVTFTQDLDTSLINDDTVSLEKFTEDSIALRIPAVAALSTDNFAVLMITPRKALDAGDYRVILRGTDGGALANLQGRTLGANVTIKFSVEPAP